MKPMRTTVRRGLLSAVLSVAVAMPGMAQDLSAYEAAEAAALAAWRDLPLMARNAEFVTGEAGGYGLNETRGSNVFTTEEPIHVYLEPMGYAWRENADGTYSINLSIDLILRNAAGEAIAGQEQFQRAEITSKHRNRGFYATLTLNLTNAPPNDYQLEYVINDLVGDQSTSVTLPFTLVAP